MNWPSRSEYTEAVRSYPQRSLKDPTLKGGKPKIGTDGFPMSYSGGFSIVFPIVKGSNTFALRCWMEDVGNAAVRYKEIYDYLQRVGLPYFVDFEYVPKGIWVMGNDLPITRMQWAAGVSLRDFISQNLKRPRLFKVVADAFQEMVATLHKNEIAHGDLQDGNILINQNRNTVEIKLIDYDSLFVPALRGQPDDIRGLPEYQHPVRFTANAGTQATKKLDYFSELVIYLSFLALSEKPDLWGSFKDKTERGLLFSEADFKNPGQSAIFRELANLSPDVRQLASTLKDFRAKTSIDQLAPLEAVLPKSDPKTHTDRGFSLLKNDQYQEALTEFQKAIALDPKYERAQLGLGRVYRQTKKYQAAINTFEKIIQQVPKYKEAHHGLAVAYYESGDNSKATTAANAALRIDAHYQPSRELLDAIKSSTSTSIFGASSTPSKQTGNSRSTASTSGASSTPSKQTTTQRSTTSSTPSSTGSSRRPTNPPSGSNTSQAARTNPGTNIWQYTTGVLGLAFAVCLIVLLTRGGTGGEAAPQITQLKNQLTQKDSEIQNLNSAVLTLEKDKEDLAREKDRLQAELAGFGPDPGVTLGDLVALRQKLSDQEEKNQDLQAQLGKKDDEIGQLRDKNATTLNENRGLRNQLAQTGRGVTDRDTTLQNLRNERTKVLEENQTLRDRLTRKTSEAENLTKRVEQLQNEKTEIQRQNEKLQNENRDLTRLNKKFGDQIRTLRPQPEERQQNTLKINPELPKKVQNYRSVLPRAVSSNNQGVTAFDRGDYNKAINHFTTAIKADSKFAIAHYNLGCVYLYTEKYHDAIRVLNKTVAIDPKFKEAYYNRSLAYFKTDELQKAKEDATSAININPHYERGLELWGAIEKLH